MQAFFLIVLNSLSLRCSMQHVLEATSQGPQSKSGAILQMQLLTAQSSDFSSAYSEGPCRFTQQDASAKRCRCQLYGPEAISQEHVTQGAPHLVRLRSSWRCSPVKRARLDMPCTSLLNVKILWQSMVRLHMLAQKRALISPHSPLHEQGSWSGGTK